MAMLRHAHRHPLPPYPISRPIVSLSYYHTQKAVLLYRPRNDSRLLPQQRSPFLIRPPHKPTNQPIRSYSDFSSELGLRSHLPPDSNSPPEPNKHDNDREPDAVISDQEWEIRTGRAIYVLQQTLPDFFSTGLITSIDKITGNPRSSTSVHIPIANANPLDFRTANEEVESIYSPRVRLSYTPPVALPTPFPKTLHVEGLPLYMASSVFIRHTLNALYSDLHVTMRRITVQDPSSPHSGPGVDSGGSDGTPVGEGKRKSREKSLFVGLSVTGTARVSGGPGEWEVNSTYTFSPVTGLIHTHTVNSIHPAPHQAVYDALRASLGKVFGLGLLGEGSRGTRPGGAGAAYEGGVGEDVGGKERKG